MVVETRMRYPKVYRRPDVGGSIDGCEWYYLRYVYIISRNAAVVSRGQTFARGGGACGEEEPVARLDTVAGFSLATPESWRDQSRCRTAIMGVT